MHRHGQDRGYVRPDKGLAEWLVSDLSMSELKRETYPGRLLASPGKEVHRSFKDFSIHRHPQSLAI
jgi:hypothetical protein